MAFKSRGSLMVETPRTSNKVKLKSEVEIGTSFAGSSSGARFGPELVKIIGPNVY